MARLSPYLSPAESQIVLQKLLEAFQKPRTTEGIGKELLPEKPGLVLDLLHSLRSIGIISTLYRWGKADVCVLDPNGVDAFIGLLEAPTQAAIDHLVETVEHMKALDEKDKESSTSTAPFPTPGE